MASEDWTWEFRPPAARAFENIETDIQDRIVDKLDAIVTDKWREPREYVEPLSGMPHGKIRVGDFRLGAMGDLFVHSDEVEYLDDDSSIYDSMLLFC